jgi:hypothetical protein
MEFQFNDVPDSARVIRDDDGDVWVKSFGRWECLTPSLQNANYTPQEMSEFEPYTVFSVDPPAPAVGIQETPVKGGSVNLGPGIYRVRIVEGHAEFGLWGV